MPSRADPAQNPKPKIQELKTESKLKPPLLPFDNASHSAKLLVALIEQRIDRFLR